MFCSQFAKIKGFSLGAVSTDLAGPTCMRNDVTRFFWMCWIDTACVSAWGHNIPDVTQELKGRNCNHLRSGQELQRNTGVKQSERVQFKMTLTDTRNNYFVLKAAKNSQMSDMKMFCFERFFTFGETLNFSQYATPTLMDSSKRSGQVENCIFACSERYPIDEWHDQSSTHLIWLISCNLDHVKRHQVNRKG